MKKGKLLKKEKGITLIALVITIVVMLILAGVTINLTLGENGIFTTAQQAAKNYTEAQNKEMSVIDSFTNAVDKLTSGKVYYATDSEGNTIPVPTGFSPITTPDQGTKDTGFVIKNDTDGNEFVWVPVGGIENYKRVAWWKEDWKNRQTLNEITGEITRADLGTSVVWTEIMPVDERDSVTVYGGFYIGRYETGIIGGMMADTKTEGTYYSGTNMQAVVKAGQQVWNYIEKGRALKEATNLYNKTENNVTSKLCSSYAWDTTLKFIERQNSIYPTNSDGGYYGKTAPTTTGYDTIHPCNIYDMGGHVWEWTTESSSDKSEPCVVRGGGFNDNPSLEPASNRSYYNANNAYHQFGFRITLYL